MRDKNAVMNFASQVRGLAALLIILLGSATAHGADFKTQYDLALALYQAQKFEESIPEFKAAYQLTAKPGLLFNLAQAYRKAGHPREAIEYYDRYLSATPQIDGDTRHKVDGYLAEARNTLAALELEMKRRLAEDKAAHEQEPEAAPLAPAAPPLLPGGLTAAVPGTAPVAPGASDSRSASRPTDQLWQRWWLWTAIGGALVAGVIVGVAVGTQHTNTPIVVATGVPRGTITF